MEFQCERILIRRSTKLVSVNRYLNVIHRRFDFSDRHRTESGTQLYVGRCIELSLRRFLWIATIEHVTCFETRRVMEVVIKK